jgi:hypothetical protein
LKRKLLIDKGGKNMYEMKYAYELTEKDWENIKLSNPKVYEVLQNRINDNTYSDIVVIFDKDGKFVFFDYVD